MAEGYEKTLITQQLEHNVGLFTCDRHAVYSSEILKLGSLYGSEVLTENIGDMHCERGGPFWLALNSEIFVRAWKRVVKDRYHEQTQYTVKVDPDCVFLPSRLR